MKLIFFVLLLIIPMHLPGQDLLDEYIRFGLENNLTLKQKYSDYQKSIEALREARGLFYPGISLNARYTVSEGGRVIDFPVGDLLNPVYSTLNALTSSDLFPQVDNQQIKFLRPTEHETKIRLAQPVFNTDIYYNSKIKKELTFYEDADLNQYKRELVSEIKKAYYNLAMTDGILSMLKETRKLLLENIRVNKKLIENDKVTKDALYRSEAELNKFDQELQNAEKNRTVAGAYFNFLLNRKLDDSVNIQRPVTFPMLGDYINNYADSALGNREEIKKLEEYRNISDLKVKMNQAGKLPDMFVVVDYGFQGEDYRFNKNQDYLQASAILSWNLFSGFQNRARIKQAIIDKSQLDLRLDEVKKQIELQVINILKELEAAEKGITAAESRLLNSREGFRLMRRKYEEGQASLLEYLDARTNLTQAEENLIISRFTYLSDYAEFEKVTAVNKY
jgi:outer membrane protein